MRGLKLKTAFPWKSPSGGRRTFPTPHPTSRRLEEPSPGGLPVRPASSRAPRRIAPSLRHRAALLCDGALRRHKTSTSLLPRSPSTCAPFSAFHAAKLEPGFPRPPARGQALAAGSASSPSAGDSDDSWTFVRTPRSLGLLLLLAASSRLPGPRNTGMPLAGTARSASSIRTPSSFSDQ